MLLFFLIFKYMQMSCSITKRKEMRRQIIITVLAGILLAAFGTTAHAQTKPIQLALVNPVQVFPESNSIEGLRLSLLYGKNATVKGLDLGLVNHTTSGTSLGLQLGLVGLNEGGFTGLQWDFVNMSDQNVEGFQWGFFNHAGRMSGLQLGFINTTGSMKGVQVGLLNFIKTGGQFPVFPIVNWSF